MYHYIYRITLPVKNIWRLAIVLIFVPVGRSQDRSPVFKNFSKELTSSETYDLAQDERGKIWIVSDRGLTMYDGNKFHVIPTHNVIQTNAIFGIKEEHENCFWLITKRNELFSFDPLSDNITIKPYEHNKNLREHLKVYPSEQFINNITWQNDSLYVSFLQPDRVTVDLKGQVVNSNKRPGNYDCISSDVLVLHNNQPHPYTSYLLGKNTGHNSKIMIELANHETLELVLSPTFEVSEKMKSVSMFCEKNGAEYFAIGRYLIQKSKSSEYNVLTLDAEILDFDFNGNDLIVGTFKGVYEADSNLIIKDHYLANQSISSVLQDKDNGFWFTSLSKGVFYTPNINLKVYYGTENFSLKSLTIYKDNVVCNDNNLMTYVLRNKRLDKFGYIVQLGDMFRYPNRNAEEILGPSCLDGFSRVYNYLPLKYIDSTKKERLITAYGKFIRVQQRGEVETYQQDSIPYILSCLQLNDSTALLGTAGGVVRYEYKQKPKKHSVKGFGISSDVREIIEVGGQFVYLINDGLIVENDIKSYKINRANGLENDFLSGIRKENDNSFWAYGNEGINLIKLRGDNFKIVRFKEFNYLPSKEVSAFAVDQNNIYLGTKSGVCHIQKNRLTEGSILNKNHFSVDSVLSKGERISISDTIKLEPENNNLSFYFNYINFSDCDVHIEYQYGNESQWLETNESSIQLTSMPYGAQPISFRAVYNNEILKLNSYVIIVRTPINKQWWFIPVLMLIAIIPLFILFRWMLLRRQKKEQERIKLEMSLLSSRMNPHFTFNTISSIQSYILKNEKAPAIKYLSDFGLLMRKSLDYSYKDYINVSDELDFLKLLVELENKRFEADFNLKVIRKDKGRNFKIPAMLIQPIVENVILHCVFPEGAEKMIFIEIEETKSHHVISVEDFGINQPKKPKNKHESFGLSIVRDRIKLHNGKHFVPADFEIINKKGENEQGYKVTIKLLKK